MRPLLLAAVAVALMLSSNAAAKRPLTPPAPEFPPGDIWLNSSPLTLKALRKKSVVVVSFINATSINSIRTFKVLKAWQERYGGRGMTLIGVHTPDYDFQGDPQAAATALKRFNITFPVVLDSNRGIWKAYANEGWPAVYLVDRLGQIVFDRLGEGRYGEFEDELRQALSELSDFKPQPQTDLVEDPLEEDCGAMTPEAQLGTRRGKAVKLHETETRLVFLTAANDGVTGFQGSWSPEPDYLRLKENNPERTGFVSVIYRGSQAFSVFGPGRGPSRVYVRQDDLWMHPRNAGKDVKFDDDGRSFVNADATRLYQLAQNPTDDPHELTLIPAKAGAKVYSFSFSNRCLAPFVP